jgi:hypothetical protein
MSHRTLVISAIVGNCAVAAICYVVYGWNEIGSHVAARSTARFAVVLFIVAFAQPGLARWIAVFPSYAAMVHTFVAAQCVHFVTVAIVLALDTTHHFSRDPGTALAVIVVGSILVIMTGVTAGHRGTRGMRFLHALFLYPVFAIFMAAFAHHHKLELRAIALLLAISLVVRIVGEMMDARRTAAVQAGLLSTTV